MKILSYNVRGLGKKAKRREVRDIIKKQKIDLCCIQETKLEEVSKIRCTGESEGRSGGILSIWNNDVFHKSSSWSVRGVLVINGFFTGDNSRGVLMNVYAPCLSSEKTMGNNQANSESEYGRQGMHGGRFQLDPKIWGKEIFSTLRNSFNRAICKNYQWWVGHSRGTARMDRAKSFPNHIPLALLSGTKDWGPRPFRFMNSWLEHPQFKDFFQEKWKSYSIEGWAAYRLKEKLKLLKKDIRDWNKCIFGDIDHNIDSKMKEIEVLDRIDDAMGLEEVEVIQQNKSTAELIKFGQWKEKLLAQKAKARWLKEGDVNLSYFHGWINKNRRANTIEGLLINERWSDSVEDVKKGIHEHFEHHFRKFTLRRSEEDIWRWRHNDGLFSTASAY
ncbi:hypothetical protein ACS0TY_011630 [Phlomoides rotata]